MAIEARECGLKKLFVPVGNYGEAILVKGIEVYAFRTLLELVNYLQGILEYQPPVLSVIDRPTSEKDGLLAGTSPAGQRSGQVPGSAPRKGRIL